MLLLIEPPALNVMSPLSACMLMLCPAKIRVSIPLESLIDLVFDSKLISPSDAVKSMFPFPVTLKSIPLPDSRVIVFEADFMLMLPAEDSTSMF